MSPTPRNAKPKGPRVSGEAFRRVDDEIWGKEIIEGLEDNSCKRTCHACFSFLVRVCYNTLKSPLPFKKSILFCCKKHSEIMYEDLVTPISEIFRGTDV